MSFNELKKDTSYLPAHERAEVKRAFAFADAAHADQLRKSGEPYMVHIMATVRELAAMHMDVACLVAGCLHDVPEDTKYSFSDIEREFGAEVARLVNGVTKLGKVRLRSQEEQQANNLRKMFLAMAEDVRVIIIKLCDRLHNMRTIGYLPRNKQRGIANETLEIYAPLANRLGMAELRWQLEDLCLKTLEPKIYADIERQVHETRLEREEKINTLIGTLEDALTKANIMARVYGRPKHLYSIYRNVYVLKKEMSIQNMLDSLGIRVIVDDVQECYQALGVVHSLWRPIIGRFKDHIAIPKSNNYQSLHTGVICGKGCKLEVQIRTEEMNYLAEYGMASHWRYKGSYEEMDAHTEERMNWIHQLLDWQKEFRTALDFVESLKLDLFEDQIFVFTPRGDVKDLPKGATPIDFAYSVHTNLGHSCIGAKINGRMVPLNYQLQMGDIVEILRSSQIRGPSRGWLDSVKTSGAKEKIRAWFRRQEYGDNIASGKKRVQEELQKIHRIALADIDEKKLNEVKTSYNYKKIDDMWAAIGYGALSPLQVVRRLSGTDEPLVDDLPAIRKLTPVVRDKDSLEIKGVKDFLVKMAPCCQPLPGDKIVGYITRGKGITIHRLSCKNITHAKREEPERVVPLDWEEKSFTEHEVNLILEAQDRIGLMRDVVTYIGDKGVFIAGVNYNRDRKTNNAKIELAISVNNLEQLSELIHGLESMPGTYSVHRSFA
ncbi:MAG TPA: bifunctional (p)ppGpp synthetase/guanosine-3',5'-bis(diphosphate) 3'-pyrophosphohydrolase [bacterium]|nr:bifunctional (p)ppGpp synthetase/guanosine-3',5'-bis(diphosphate) 3'-pyrophosphohydrolase [bacterium]